MTNTAPITLEQLFRFYRGLPHQAAAIPELEADLRTNGYDAAMRRDQPWFATWSQSGKQTEAIYLAPAEKIIKHWEALHQTACQSKLGLGVPERSCLGSSHR